MLLSEYLLNLLATYIRCKVELQTVKGRCYIQSHTYIHLNMSPLQRFKFFDFKYSNNAFVNFNNAQQN